MSIIRATALPFLILALAAPAVARVKTAAPVFTAAAANDATKKPILTSASKAGSSILRAQILLDRAHCSPGEIDGRYGGNTRLSAAAFNLSRRINGGSNVAVATWDALNRDVAPVLVAYTITADDVAGPF